MRRHCVSSVVGLPLLRSLWGAFAKRGMRGHLRNVRLYALALRHGLLETDGALRASLTREDILEWMRVLAVPPFHLVYERRPRGAPCPVCGPAPASHLSPQVSMAFPGGERARCPRCSAVWVAEAPPAWRARRE